MDFSDIDPSFDKEKEKIGQVTVPTQFSEEDREEVLTVKGSGEASKAAFVGTAIMTLLLTGALSEVWSLLNGM